MQTFLPYENFIKSAEVLDYRRLGKQRIEGLTILKILNGQNNKKGWVNHPAVNMWRGHRGMLKIYVQSVINEWIKRGYKNTIDLSRFADDENTVPKWFGSNSFHTAHKSNLIRKQNETEAKGRKLDKNYREIWREIPADLPYIWG